jgi:hypothetical protein
MNELIKFYQEDSPTSRPQFWEGKCWDWFEKNAKQFDSEADANATKDLIECEDGLKISVHLHEFVLEKYKTWENKNWYKVLRLNSRICVGTIGYTASGVFGDGWNLNLYVGKPRVFNFHGSGIKSFEQAIAIAEDFLGGKIIGEQGEL